MSILMPLYTIGIVIFFVYTIMKVRVQYMLVMVLQNLTHNCIKW